MRNSDQPRSRVERRESAHGDWPLKNPLAADVNAKRHQFHPFIISIYFPTLYCFIINGEVEYLYYIGCIASVIAFLTMRVHFLNQYTLYSDVIVTIGNGNDSYCFHTLYRISY